MSVKYPFPTITDHVLSSSKARGERLKALRLMSGCTRNAFAKKYHLSASTLQSWEAAKAGGLTQRGAENMIALLRQEGICCSVEWLMYGVGSSPQLTNLQLPVLEESIQPHDYSISEHSVVHSELLLFRHQNAESMELLVQDDGMTPHYQIGDYVAGRKRKGNDIARLTGYDCIVQLEGGECLLRRLRANSDAGFYDLVCTNYNTELPFPTLYTQEIVTAAPVIWHRRLDPLPS